MATFDPLYNFPHFLSSSVARVVLGSLWSPCRSSAGFGKSVFWLPAAVLPYMATIWAYRNNSVEQHLTNVSCVLCAVLQSQKYSVLFFISYTYAVCVCMSVCVWPCVCVLCCFFKFSSQCRVLFLEVKASEQSGATYCTDRHELQPCAQPSIAPRPTRRAPLSAPRQTSSSPTIWASLTRWNFWRSVRSSLSSEGSLDSQLQADPVDSRFRPEVGERGTEACREHHLFKVNWDGALE